MNGAKAVAACLRQRLGKTGVARMNQADSLARMGASDMAAQ